MGIATAGIGGGGPAPAAASGHPPATAAVTRQTLVQTVDLDGTLGYGDPVPLTGRATGTVTWLPAAGAHVTRGQPVYKADNLPVPLLYGSLPLYRPMTANTDGPDVAQLQQNLKALGYHVNLDGRFTALTSAAVKKWQKDLGLTQTGTVDPAAAVVAPGEIRVADLKAHLGDPAGGGPVLDYTGTTRMVTASLSVDDEPLAKRGATVTVGLPGDTSTPGTIADIGHAVAAAPQNPGTSGQDPGGQQSSPTVTLVVTVPNQAALGDFDAAPVSVTLVADQHKDVLVVPVAALLALAEGGYAVQVVDGDTTRLVPVQLGMFAGGKVEVRGDGITTGTVVVTAS